MSLCLLFSEVWSKLEVLIMSVMFEILYKELEITKQSWKDHTSEASRQKKTWWADRRWKSDHFV